MNKRSVLTEIIIKVITAVLTAALMTLSVQMGSTLRRQVIEIWLNGQYVDYKQ